MSRLAERFATAQAQNLADLAELIRNTLTVNEVPFTHVSVLGNEVIASGTTDIRVTAETLLDLDHRLVTTFTLDGTTTRSGHDIAAKTLNALR